MLEHVETDFCVGVGSDQSTLFYVAAEHHFAKEFF
jgi:hypothetical protein